MTITYLKKSPKTSSTNDSKTTKIVQDLLKNIESTKEQGCIDLTKKFDKYEGDIIISKERIEEIKKTLNQKTKDDVQFSYERVRKFAEAQVNK
jgi:sulfopropanediol 3-dehydrogenase